MMKVVVNGCYGGFVLSKKAREILSTHSDAYHLAWREGRDRTNPYLISVVEKLGREAAGAHSQLYVVEVPCGVKWHIEEEDGKEWVAEDHRTWRP